MNFFQNLPFNILGKKSQTNLEIDPSLKSQQPTVLNPSAPVPSAPKTLAELEKEMEAQGQIPRIYPHFEGAKKQNRILSKTIWAVILLGIPVGAVWLANLPYSIIRGTVSRNAPILLLPSYISMDSHYRQAIAKVEQAQQLIEQPTSPADLELGEDKVKQAQQHLDGLPIGFLNDWSEYKYWWYDSRLSIYGFNSARTKVGHLEAKVFQEKNAQMLLTDSEQVLSQAKQQYQQALTSTDKKAAIASWHSAIDKLQQIPSQTLAGKTAQNKLKSDKREFEEIVGLAAGNERISALITAAQKFSWQAAKAGQNPPHPVAEWQEIENLWQEAINRLRQVPSQDLAGYAQAQELLANAQANLAAVSIRRQAQQDSVYTLDSAQRQIQSLLASTPTNPQSLDRNRTISQLQGIINQLKKVQPGTTAYLEAQQLLLSANNKLSQLQAK
ncbi:MAG: hypothetical protein ACR2LR_24920 [Hassallia sp.]